MSYDQKLDDPRWKAKREDILERDGHRCTKCPSHKHLQVHHLGYILGAQPWEYPNEFLITLCEKCHAKEEWYKREIKSLLREYTIKHITNEEIYNHLKKMTDGGE